MKFVPPRTVVKLKSAGTSEETSAEAPTSSSIEQKETSQNDKAVQTIDPKQRRNNVAVASSSGSQRYNCRPRKPVCYVDFEEPDFDEFIWCEECMDYVYEYCSMHLPLIVLPDDDVPSAAELVNFTLTRAELSLPSFFLHIAPSSIEGAGLGVFPTLPMPKGVRFGPYCGDKKPETDFSPYGWLIHGTRKRKTFTMCGDNPNTSNWMRYINCSRNWHEQNLVPFQYQGKIYYRTIKNIPIGRELLVFYGSEYAKNLGVDLFMYNAPRSRLTGTWGPTKKPRCESITTPDLQKQTQSQLMKPEETVPETTGFDTSATNGPSNTAEAIQTAGCKEANTMVNVTLKQKFECDLCHKIFPWKGNLMAHMLIHIPKRSSENLQPRQNARYDKKIEKNDNDNTNVLSSLDVTRDRHNINKNEFSVCSKTFNDKSKLTQHILVHTGEKPHHCTVCSKTFSLKGSLTLHALVHTGEKPHQCTVCSRSFSQKNNLTRHMLVHTGEKPHQCTVCSKTFSIKGNLTLHMLVHTGEKPHQCTVCSKTFSIKGNLTLHMLVHTGEKPHQCTVCSSTFSLKINLTRHMLVHTGEKPHQCTVCSSAFSQKNDLTRHMLVHTGEKPHQCTVCSSAFNQKGSLTKHMLVHTGEKPHQCTVCSKTFSEKGSLRKHMLVHTGEKPHQCTVCSKTFSQKTNLTHHMLVHTGEKARQCTVVHLVEKDP